MSVIKYFIGKEEYIVNTHFERVKQYQNIINELTYFLNHEPGDNN